MGCLLRKGNICLTYVIKIPFSVIKLVIEKKNMSIRCVWTLWWVLVLLVLDEPRILNDLHASKRSTRWQSTGVS